MITVLGPRGPAALPSLATVLRDAGRGTVNAIMLDANLCLDLALFAEGRLTEPLRTEIATFLERLTITGVDTLPGFGLAELSLQRHEWTIDDRRLRSLEAAISHSLELPATEIQRFLGAEARSFRVSDEPPLEVGLVVPLLKLFYLCTLKMHAIARKGLSRDRAFPAVVEYLEWAMGDLDVNVVLSLQVALALFGGDSQARRFLALANSNASSAPLWGAAWDMLHFHQLIQGTVEGIEKRPHRLYLATRDQAAFTMLSKVVFVGKAVVPDNTTRQMFGIRTEFPHFAHQQQDLAQLLAQHRVGVPRKRENLEQWRNVARLDALIGSLEEGLGFSQER